MSTKQAANPEGRARGGRARADRLSPDERHDIARKAAAERWRGDLPTVLCGAPDKPLRIGDVEIPCYVLDDNTRVLTQAGVQAALGKHPKANVRREPDGSLIPAVLQGAGLRPYVTQEVLDTCRPLAFTLPSGVRASGYDATALPVVCEVYLKAREAGTLDRQQEKAAHMAEVLTRGLARVGIIALVDEATGYQEFRQRDALAKILEAFVAKALQPWIATFPEDYYREIFRLRGLEYPTGTVQRPQYFGHLTNDIIYRRLAPGVLGELKAVAVRGETGRLRHRLFQRLTTNVGYPKLREHLGSVVTIMKLSSGWNDFKVKLDRLHPRYGDNLVLPFDDDQDDGRGL